MAHIVAGEVDVNAAGERQVGDISICIVGRAADEGNVGWARSLQQGFLRDGAGNLSCMEQSTFLVRLNDQYY